MIRLMKTLIGFWRIEPLYVAIYWDEL